AKLFSIANFYSALIRSPVNNTTGLPRRHGAAVVRALIRCHFFKVYGEPHGMINAMKTTIDSAGRLVIPKEIRQHAGLKPGMPLEVRLHEGRIEIEPASLEIKLERRGRLV